MNNFNDSPNSMMGLACKHGNAANNCFRCVRIELYSQPWIDKITKRLHRALHRAFMSKSKVKENQREEMIQAGSRIVSHAEKLGWLE